MKLSGARILLRADGGEGIGMGKLIPTLALARKLRAEGANVLFTTVRHHMWSRPVFKGMPVKIFPRCFFQESLELTDREIKKFKPEIIVLNITDPDAYLEDKILSRFPEWILDLKKRGIKVVGIEGGVTKDYHPNALINWNINPKWHKYERFSDVKYFIGEKFVILREPFTKVQKKKVANFCKNVFVSIGGGTEGAEGVLFPRIMSALSLAGFSGRVVFAVGAAYQDPKNLVPLIARWSNAEVLHGVSAEDLANMMLKSDLAITAAGITLYELCCIGIPSITVSIVPHQVSNAKVFAKAGATKDVGMNPSIGGIQKVASKLLYDFKERRRMSEAAKKLVDGKGLDRVLSIMKRL